VRQMLVDEAWGPGNAKCRRSLGAQATSLAEREARNMSTEESSFLLVFILTNQISRYALSKRGRLRSQELRVPVMLFCC
jgi:hypothetical protein